MTREARDNEIKAYKAEGMSVRDIAARVGLSKTRVQDILTGREWQPSAKRRTVKCLGEKCGWRGARSIVAAKPCPYCGSKVVAYVG